MTNEITPYERVIEWLEESRRTAVSAAAAMRTLLEERDEMSDENDRLAAENARLRAALEPFVPLPPSGNVEEVVTQRPLLTYLAQQKASLEWIAERAALMDDNKNLQTYRAEINDLSRYIESVKALLRPIVARAALGGQEAEQEA